MNSEGMTTQPEQPARDFEAVKPLLRDEHACETAEEGWRPCPFWLCERPDHSHDI